MDQLMATAANIIVEAQKPVWVVLGIVFMVSGYYFMTGGQQGRGLAKGFLVTGIIGSILVVGANVFQSTIAGTSAF